MSEVSKEEDSEMEMVSLVRPAITINITRSETGDETLALPNYETEGAAGMDARACLPLDQRKEGITLLPGTSVLVPTGLIMQIPVGFEMQVRPRSGLAFKNGVTVLNAPGTIDSDYRGEVGILLINLGQQPFTISHGDRIAQFVFAPVSRVDWFLATEVSETERGKGGFGSTGS